MKFFYLTISLLCLVLLESQTAHCQANENQVSTVGTSATTKKLKLESDFLLNGIGFKEAQDESQLVSFTVNPRADYQLVDSSFGVRGDIMLNLVNGRSQSRFWNPNFSFFNMMEMVAYFQPAAFFGLEAGVINQEKQFNNRMFIADRGFPALKLSTGYENKKISIKPNAQYAIPTSTSLESERTEAEALPTLTSIGLELKWTPRDWVKLESQVHQFEYNNLPSVVAFQGSRLGNSVFGVNPSESFFRYSFAGLVQSHGLTFAYLPKIQQTFKVALVENQNAPSDRQRSQWVGTELKLDFSNVTIRPEYGVFFAESDSTAALYSAFEFGRNNREGQFIGLEVEMKSLGVTIKSNFVDSRLIESTPLQADMQIFNFGLEFNNVAL